MSAEYQYKKQLDNIIENIYFNDSKLKAYKAFRLQIIDKTLKSYSGLYNQKSKTITVYDIHDDEGNNIITLLHELAHHLDYVKNGTTGHQAPFYQEFSLLLYSALDLEYVDMDTLRSMAHRNSDFNKVNRILDNYIKKEPQIAIPDDIIISVSNSFAIKDVLRKNGYFWNGVSKAWYKTIVEKDVEKEKVFLINLGEKKEDIKISSSGKIDFKTNKNKYDHYIRINNGYDIKEELKQDGFLGINKTSNGKRALQKH